MQRLDRDVTAVPEIKPATIRREVPVRVPEVGSDWAIPLLWAVTSGTICFGVMAVFLALLRAPVRWSWFVGGLVTAVVWFSLMYNWIPHLLNAVEEITGTDLNQDGQVGDRPVLTVEVVNPDSNRIQFLELPTTPEKLALLAAGTVQQGRPLSEAQWTGSGAPFSKREFRDLLNALADRGLVVWRDPNYPTQGRVLTAFGRRIFGEMCEVRTAQARIRTPGVPGALIAPDYRAVGEGER